VQHVFGIPFPEIPHGYFFREMWEPSGYIRDGIKIQWQMESKSASDYCWTLVREAQTEECKREKKRKRVSDDIFIYF
jgi:hypothetical protein